MNTNWLLAAAVLATAIGAPVRTVAGDMEMAQPTASTGVRVPFLHGLPSGEIRGRSELASLERAVAWMN